MRAIMLALVLAVSLPIGIAAAASGSADSQDTGPTGTNPRGIWLTTRYPALAVRKGEPATIALHLRNYGEPPTRVDLSVDDLPKGWTAEFRGGGQPIGAAMAPTDDSVALDLHLDLPETVKPGTYDLTVRAAGDNADLRLPLAVTVAEQLPPKLSLEPQFPNLVGRLSSDFTFRIGLKNDSGRDLLVNLGADAPSGFRVSFTEAYGSQELTSIPVKAGQNKDIQAKVELPRGVAAGRYKVTVAAAAEGVEARTTLGLEVTGEPQLAISGSDGRLSGDAVSGESSKLALVVANSGSAVARGVELSASPPSGWTVEFDPKVIDAIAPNATKDVTASITPAPKAIAGDYMVSVRANGEDASESADFRITVRTATLWGMAGVAVIVVALLVLFGAVLRFGRR